MHDTPTMSVEDKFNINLNQNLWGGVVVAYVALGVAEHWCLRWCSGCPLSWQSG
jgi:hypothetical protein